ncbi:Acyl-CoA N-acyltransferase [Phytophthora cactorum]|nr:Acyl-CoA N-acyltransferase [Phytophthora cactorum]
MLTPVVLIGIAAGAMVFVGSLLAVFLLLRQGGSFDRMAQEAVGLPAKLGEQKPLLYDELLDKAKTLGIRPPPLGTNKVLGGERVCVRDFVASGDVTDLFAVSCGEPRGGIFRDLTFDADEMIWRYLPMDPSLRKQPIGMVTLGEHSPRNLRIELMNLWLAPAFQGTAALAEVVLLLLKYLFDNGYRRLPTRWASPLRRDAEAPYHQGLQLRHVVFATINSEWGVMEEHLQHKLRQALQKEESSASADGEAEKKKTR